MKFHLSEKFVLLLPLRPIVFIFGLMERERKKNTVSIICGRSSTFEVWTSMGSLPLVDLSSDYKNKLRLNISILGKTLLPLKQAE